MHIGFLTPEYPNTSRPDGGLANYVRKISIELISRGHKVTVFVLTGENRYWIDEGIQIHQLKSFRFNWRLRKSNSLPLRNSLDFLEQWVNSKRLKKYVLRIHKTQQIDILQTSNYRAPGFALCNNGLIPVVCRCSGYGPSLRAANGQQRIFKYTLQDWLENSVILNADSAFVPSNLVAGLYERFEAFRPRVIRTPIELPKVTPDECKYQEFLDGKKYILFFGTLMGVKGVDILIRISPKLLKNFPELNIAFVGNNGPVPGNEDAVGLMHRELAGYKSRFFYHPALQRSQLYPIIQNAIGVVMPSRIDNYPNACLEALALGVPVIGTYESSLEEMIVDGITGFLAKNNDQDSLYQAIERLLELDCNKLQKMKEDIIATVNSYKTEDRVEELLEFYRQTIAKFKCLENGI